MKDLPLCDMKFWKEESIGFGIHSTTQSMSMGAASPLGLGEVAGAPLAIAALVSSSTTLPIATTSSTLSTCASKRSKPQQPQTR